MEKELRIYVVIPGEVAWNRDLCSTDKELFSSINSLGTGGKKVFATNEYFAFKLNIKEQAVTKSLQRLKEYGYIIIKGTRRSRKIEIDNTYKDKYHYLILEQNKPFVSRRNQNNETTVDHPNQNNETTVDHPSYIYKENKAYKENTLSKDNLAKDLSLARNKIKSNKNVEMIINHWNNISTKILRKCRRDPESVTYKKIVIGIKKALKDHSRKEIIIAITHWYEIITDPYSKINYKDPIVATQLDEFFKPDTRHVEKYSNVKSIPITFISCFLEAIQGKEYLQATYKSVPVIKDLEVVTEFKKLWRIYLKEFNRPVTKRLNPDKEILVIKICNYFVDFYKDIENEIIRMPTLGGGKKKKSAAYFLKILFKSFENKSNMEIHYLFKKDYFKSDFKYWLEQNEYIGIKRTLKKRLRYKAG